MNAGHIQVSGCDFNDLYEAKVGSSCIFDNFSVEDSNELTMMVFACQSLIIYCAVSVFASTEIVKRIT